jgi:Protein of unknown function (DUF2934)
MSRAVSSPQTRTPASTPARTPAPATGQIPHEKIAQRAYEKWMKRGCPHGTDVQDWVEAEAELRAETGYSVKQGMPTTRH